MLFGRAREEKTGGFKRRLTQVCAAALIIALMISGSAGASEIGVLKHRTVDGVDYVEKTDVTMIMVMGVDRRQEEQTLKVRDAGQSDFIMLVIIDHKDKVIRRLQFDRDMVLPIPTTNVFGKRMPDREMQICLAHAYGGGGEQSCQFVMEPLNKLLDTNVDLYFSMTMDAIGIINDTLGGVTVVIPEDFTVEDPAMAKGATLTLTARQAEILVRIRRTVSDGSNQTRMVRQRSFIDAAGHQFVDKVREDNSFFDTMMDALKDVSLTNVTRGRLLNELNRAYNYDILPVETLTGEYKMGENGYKQFHVDPESVEAWTLENLFEAND